MAYVGYDPMAHGARCEDCILRGQKPVPCNGPKDAEFIVIAEAPGPTEERMGVPLVGPSGQMLDTALTMAGLPRSRVLATNVLLCRPHHDGDLDATLQDLARQNKQYLKEVKQWRAAVARIWTRFNKQLATQRRAIEKQQVAARRATEKYNQACDLYERSLQQLAADAAILNTRLGLADKSRVPRAPSRRRKAPPEPPVPPAPLAVSSTSLWKLQPPPLPLPPRGRVLPTPMEACRPRLLRDLSQGKFFLTLGRHALQALDPVKASIMDEQGAPFIPKGIPNTHNFRHFGALGVLHPAAIMRALPHYRAAFTLWVSKAVRLFREGFHWKDPDPLYTPLKVAVALESLLKEADRREATGEPMIVLGYDIETDGTALGLYRIRVLGLSWGETSVVVPWRLISGEWVRDQMCHDLSVRVLEHPHIIKVAHQGVFDRSGLKVEGVVVLPPHGDTLLIHKTIESELPHGLAFLSAVCLDGPAWKSLGDGTHGLTLKDDKMLWLYNSIDCYRTQRIYTPLMAVLNQDKLAMQVYEQEMSLQTAVVDMGVNGLRYSTAKRGEFIARFERIRAQTYQQMIDALNAAVAAAPESPEAIRYLEVLQAAQAKLDRARESRERMLARGKVPKAPKKVSDLPGPFNPLSPTHATAALQLLGIQTPMTASGVNSAPRQSTAEDALVTALVKASPTARAWVGAKLSQRSDGAGYLGWTGAGKLRATFIDKITPAADGRVRATWKMHGTVTGRWACEEPNLMNIPEWLREPYEAEPGYTFVAADYSALELWIIAVYSQARNLLKALEAADPHLVNAEALFGFSFSERLLTDARAVACPMCAPGLGLHGPKEQGEAGKLSKWKLTGADCGICGPRVLGAFADTHAKLEKTRGLGKSFVYAANYQATVETIHANLLPDYPSLQVTQVHALSTSWNKTNPEIKNTAQKNFELFHKRLLKYNRGWLESPIMGRRRFWTGQQLKITDAANYPIQSGAGDIINGALVKLYPKMLALGGRLVFQVHDCLGFEVPRQHALTAKKLLVDIMPGPYAFRGIEGLHLFPVEAKTGDHWGEL